MPEPLKLDYGKIPRKVRDFYFEISSYDLLNDPDLMAIISPKNLALMVDKYLRSEKYKESVRVHTLLLDELLNRKTSKTKDFGSNYGGTRVV